MAELSDHHRSVGFLFLSPLEGECQTRSLASEVHFLPMSQIVELVQLLEVVEIYPVMET